MLWRSNRTLFYMRCVFSFEGVEGHAPSWLSENKFKADATKRAPPFRLQPAPLLMRHYTKRVRQNRLKHRRGRKTQVYNYVGGYANAKAHFHRYVFHR